MPKSGLLSHVYLTFETSEETELTKAKPKRLLCLSNLTNLNCSFNL